MRDRHWKSRIGFILSNQILVEGCVFVRNVIIARLLGAETLGEFIFLVLSIRLFAMSTDLAVERYILQVDKHDTGSALAGAHFLHSTRNSLLALMLLLFGVLNIQGISFTCYALLAAGAFLRGLTHQGYRLKQRHFNFRPALYVEGFTTAAGTLAIYIAASSAPYLEAICAVMLAQAALHTLLSHTCAGEPYSTNATLPRLKDMVLFGWPLMLTGISMFWSMQGERLILSATLPAAEFAHFSMLFQLALVPVLVLGRIALTAGLPALAAVRQAPLHFRHRVARIQAYIYILAAAFAALFGLGANPALVFLFGPGFRADITLIFLVAITQALRLCRTPQSIAAQALGQTDIPFKANLVRVVAVFVAVVSWLADGSLVTLLSLACAGEVCAWIAQSALFSMRNRAYTAPSAPAVHSAPTREAVQ